MNKEELIKIYSSYFPYKLEVQHIDTDWAEDRVITVVLTGVFLDCLTFNHGADYYYKDEEIVVKPILYDLSYLTKEIEHEGKIINPAEFVFGKNHNIREVIDEYIINKKGYSFRAIGLSYIQVNKLLELHINVFNLPSDKFINKATLKTN